MSEKVRLENVSKSFGKVSVLHDVSFAVKDGTLLTILGASGGGKTTLLRLIAGFDAVDSGSINMNGREVSSESMSLPPEKRNVGLCHRILRCFLTYQFQRILPTDFPI